MSSKTPVDINTVKNRTEVKSCAKIKNNVQKNIIKSVYK